MKRTTIAENFINMAFPNINEEQKKLSSKAMDVIFLLHADHEQNASTSTVRLAGSSGANPFACIAAGVSSLWGPAHGGANQAALEMLEEIGTSKNIKSTLAQVARFLTASLDKVTVDTVRGPTRAHGFVTGAVLANCK